MENNYIETQKRIGYTPRKQAQPETYEKLGFMCGLEVHQQLKTDKKLFCHCPAGVFQEKGKFHAEVIRHMRPTLSEMGGYDGTALMEFKTKKTIIYRIANETTCTYDVDDTPPFKINKQALQIALEIALLLKTNIVGELHITRKQYLDGSIPTGFQRTGIVSIEGQIPLRNKVVRIIQLSIEEDSCREISDIAHVRVYTTDRLGMPLIETVTYPDMKTPDEAYEAAQYIRFLNRSTGNVRTGIGAAREDVNVSIAGGTRVEIKGVSRINSIPELVHNEAFRQKSLLEIKSDLLTRIPFFQEWRISHAVISENNVAASSNQVFEALNKSYAIVAVNLPGFKGILSFFTQPGRMFADEISDRLKVISCIEKPNMTHSESLDSDSKSIDFRYISKLLNAKDEDAQILIWGPEADIPTALETIEERCRMAFIGVPNETRKSLENGTTMFERVLPGADRMYPDTDSAPISISEDLISNARSMLPKALNESIAQLESWEIPRDTFFYLLKNNLVPLMERISNDFKIKPIIVAALLAHRLKHIQGKFSTNLSFNFEKIYDLFVFMKEHNLEYDIAYDMLPVIYTHPEMEMMSVLKSINFTRRSRNSILSMIPSMSKKFYEINTSKDNKTKFRWMMKELRKIALGNIPLNELADIIAKVECDNE
ncbi:Glu-tRNA(Gln) amidotransferase subunit GatE [Clostridium sp. YIM B02515]|uniref:Glu-tRNA(Gln) amidotransferase subunit GatE n=1 Tax=Clostridium rhizosphaerae TaxID=2803861 RepID=A0ABS1T6S9_9CLOT|nr:Glu-tRNA(Gln) amidotransferase subunit GatE [Clostridium rhizosphaerae]MBL4935045.1 Glu-tRNA(Gln) amidotransferase subunit GatE [Clostridium rhizosphaerae]